MSAESTPEPGIPAAGPQVPGRSGGGRRRRPPRRGRRALLVTAWTAAGVLVLGGTGFGYLYFKLNGNIKSVDINQALGTDRPAKVDNGSENILVLGSDTRSGVNRKLGGGTDDGSARSDTAMIVHVYKGHRKAAVVSVPRDTLIDRPSCKDANGVRHGAATDVMFNSAYSTGGATCAVKTVEAITGVRMDHYLEVDFSGFQKLIDELGGVTVTTTKSIDDPQSHLDLKAGRHSLDGEQALGLVRTRHGVGDGSDLGRIQLQQAFIKALIDRIGGLGLFTSPTKLFSVADTATKAVTTDTGLGSVNKLTGLAESVQHLHSGDVHMVTLPVRYDPANPNRVEPIRAQADIVWAALRADKPIPADATKGSVADHVDAGKVVGGKATAPATPKPSGPAGSKPSGSASP